MTNPRKRLAVRLTIVLVVSFCVTAGLHYLFRANLLFVMLAGALGGLSVIWKQGGRDEWVKLTRASRASIIAVALAGIFTCTAVNERHEPYPLLFAVMITAAAVGLFLLYLFFSRAMDFLWYRFQNRDPR